MAALCLLGCEAGGNRTRTGSGDGGVTADRTTPESGIPEGGFPEGGFSECTASSVRAMEGFAPVDVIWVVDSSGSMSNEAERVQENLNRFSEAMGMVGIDYRVVVITTSSYVSVGPPLSTSGRYRLIDRPVSSNEPLIALLDEFPNYSDFLRRAAITHIVGVTDDESDLPAAQFRTMMLDNLERNFTFHAIASERVPGNFPDGACNNGGFPPDGAAEPGDEYYDLAGMTGGLTFSICTQDWTSLFNTLTAAVAVGTALPCVYPIPSPPDGQELDQNKVNLLYSPGAGSERPLPYIGNGNPPDCTRGGWFYDDPEAPTRINLCPLTCDEIKNDAAGQVDISFGCATFFG
ncbi:MAG: vWA domain-containing protein [Myxococcota bacterium]